MATAPAQRTRLRLERPWQEHARLYEDLFADPAVAAALWPGRLGGPRTPRQAYELLSADIEHWQERSFGPWVFFERSSGAFVGRGGLRSQTIAGRERVEVLYAVRPDAWGEGYASEMTGHALSQAHRLGLGEVVGLAASTNHASRRVLEKAGFRFEAIVEHRGLAHWLGRLGPIV
ncbi:MAG: GNAT family N-acetyltransferase [Solirubrobacteraceae bacterium]|jgi:ribosomal-protein-alanine N-acetyltransferase